MAFYIVISTCTGYEKYLDYILKSVPENLNVIIVTGNSSKNTHEIINKKLIKVFLTKNLYEYTAWVGVNLLLENSIVDTKSWFLFTHDTSAFTIESDSKISDVMATIHKTAVNFYSLAGGGFHNICVCRNPAINKIANYFKKIETMSREEAIKLECNLPKLLDRHEVGEHVVYPTQLDQNFVPGKKTSYITSVGILKFFH